MSRKTFLFVLSFLVISTFFTSIKADETKLCLTMIVKNEGKIIERCLDSVKDVVDCISICDTGSTDDTVQIIENYLEKNNIPGKVHHYEWKNFGHNRSLSVKAAQEWLRQEGYSLEDTYLLLIDADMLLEVGPNFNKDSLKADSYQCSQKNCWICYSNVRLIRASLPWKCVGVTHEYWACDQPLREDKLETLSIDDRNDGGCKSDKFERDIRLLTQGLKDEPDNERYMFYLASSYKALKQYDEAIKWYTNRIAKGGWKEEVWYSKYMIGLCYQDMGLWDKALEYYLQAYQYDPQRAETLQEISKHYRSQGENQLAYLFAKQGRQIPYPKNHLLFISYPVYDYLFDEDLSIAAYYTPYKEEGFAATNRLILKKDIPESVKKQAYQNVLYYVEKLKDAEYIPIEIDLPPIREGFPARYQPMNPSIRKTETGYQMICRTVNYHQIGAQHFKCLDLQDPAGTIRTRNFLVEYDPDFQKLSQKEIVENLPRIKHKRRNVEGLEDCRLFEFKDSLWFTCTTMDTNPTGQPQVSLCKLEDDRTKPTISVERLIPLVGPTPERCEKNWLPFVLNDEFHAIYSYDPFIIYKPNTNDPFSWINKSVMVKNVSAPLDFSRFSGSASPIKFDDGYLMLIHEVVYTNQRNYLHRFVYLDSNFNIAKVSRPFIFLHQGVEYCCGIAIDHSETQLVMSIGIEDREAFLALVNLDNVRALLNQDPPLPSQ